MLYWVNLVWAGFELKTLVVIGTDDIGSYKPNHHTITTTTALSTKFNTSLLSVSELLLFNAKWEIL
jgi:hypothetical protein